MTHAFFKALLFLGAGSVIIAMHHEQDMRNMGGLKKYMPITYWTTLVGSLALIGFPGFSGFFSKDAIIESVHASHLAGSGFAYWAVLIGVLITSLYTFRMFFMVFHGKERMDEHTREHLHETPAVVTVPLILLAIPSALVGAFAIGPMLFGEYFDGSIQVLPVHNVLEHIGEEFHGSLSFVLHGALQPPFALALLGIFGAWFFVLKRPDLADALKQRFRIIYAILVDKYGFDRFNEIFFAGGGRGIGKLFWRIGDVTLIDGLLVNGSARTVGWLAGIVRRAQSGLLYHYAFLMIIGLLALLSWIVFRTPS
jgi:NADH-quinone oxidoreductase subunit L